MNPLNQTTSTNKEPWLAVNLSKLLPGLGQFYARQVPRGVLILVLSLLSGLIGLSSLISTNVSLPMGLGLFIFNLALWIWGMYDAYQCTSQQNSKDYEANRRQRKSHWLAIFWSSIFPGLGHFYLNKPLIGILLLFLSLLLIWIPLIGIVWICFVIYITYRSVAENKQKSSKPIVQFLILFFAVAFISAPTPFLIRSYIVESRYIPAGSMEPTLQINDRLMIDKLKYRFSEPLRGDIVVFNPTETLLEQGFKDAFIKRIIGLPGERVEIKQGSVYINNQRLQESYIAKSDLTLVEACGTSSNREEPFLSKTVVIPNGSYFVLGDNRNNSYDGRCWGLVQKQEIIGKAAKIFWPFGRSGNIPSPDF